MSTIVLDGALKPTSRMVAPGAVYFFERAGGRPFGCAGAGCRSAG